MNDNTSICHLYADDTAITITASNNHDLKIRLQNEMDQASRWMAHNLLTVNTKKMKLMFFCTTHTLGHIDPPEILSNKSIIELVDQYKYLGVILDSKLTFSNHVTYTRQKAISRVKMLGKVRPMIDEQTALTSF